MIDDDELSARLGRADPVVEHPDVDEIFDAMVRDVHATRKLRGKRGRLWSVVAIGGVVALGASTLPAAADAVHDFFAYRTGSNPTGTEVIEGSRWIDTGAPDMPELVRSRFPEALPVPAGVSRADIESVVTYSMTRVHARTQEIGIDNAYESYLYCRWIDVWLVSDTQGNSDARQTATDALQDAKTWPSLAVVDGDGGAVQARREAAGAAADGRRAGVQRAFTFEGCADWQTMGLNK